MVGVNCRGKKWFNWKLTIIDYVQPLFNGPDFVGEVLDTLANGDPSPLKVIWALALAVKKAYDGVQGNKEQCKMLNDHVQLVAKALRGLPSATRQKEEVEDAMGKLVETLRSAGLLHNLLLHLFVARL